MKNEEADRIYSFWRWEYLRRNTTYIQFYRLMISSLTAMGVKGLPFNIIGEDKSDIALSFDFFKMLDDIPAKDGMEKIQKQEACRSLLEVLQSTFKIWPPTDPAAGLSAEAILEKFVRADIEGKQVDYCSMMLPKGDDFGVEYWSTLRPTHLFGPFSVIRHPEEPAGPEQMDEEVYLQKRKELLGFDYDLPLSCFKPKPLSEEETARFLEKQKKILGFDTEVPLMRSEINEETLSADRLMLMEQFPQLKDEYEARGKYFARVGAPAAVVVKDKKVLHAMEKCLKPNKSLRGIKNAIRNRDKELLRLGGRRIKRSGLPRAYGLYLWEMQKEKGYLNAGMIRDFLKKVADIYNDALPGKQDIPVKDNYVFVDSKELKKLVKNTAKCIRKGDYLPIL